MKKALGFSLIEIMVVVVIIGILAAIVVPRIMDRPEQARVVAAKQDVMTLQEALDLYKLDNGFYPSTGQGLTALVNAPSSPPVPNNYKSGGYIHKVPVDPWGRPYQYLNPGDHNKAGIDVYSLGSPGKENATIGNWEIDADKSQ